MDSSCKFLKAQTSLDDNTFPTEFRHGRSKAQISLTKILLAISSFPPTETSNQNEESVSGERNPGNRALLCEDRGFDIDLNIRLGPPPEVHEILPPSTAAEVVAENGGEVCEISVVEKTDSPEVTEKNCSEGEESGIAEEREFVPNSGIDSIGDSEETVEAEQRKSEKQEEVNGEGGLDLLIEAAELISGNFKNGESEPDKPSRNEELPDTEPANTEATAKRMKQSDFWTAEELYGNFEDLSPVVRSKRGRNQVLPYKYRDSFLEPLKPVTRQRSAAVPSKRRSR